MQVLPIFIQYFFALDSVINGIWYNIYRAMTDFLTGVIYDFITILTMIFFAYNSSRLKKTPKVNTIANLKELLNYSLIKIFVLLGMFLPIIITV
ncbi:hypothetical protein, partial [Treponema sp. JC4]|uniref:hypothetical protein n=1 Tax=Treponema sp. JC4 TaxID=1124982 RepID=UPI001ED968A9